MSLRKTKLILDQASSKALELLRRLCRDSLISPHEVIPMYDFLFTDYLTVKLKIDVDQWIAKFFMFGL